MNVSMWMWRLIALLVLLALLVGPPAVAGEDEDALADREAYVPGDVLVKFKKGTAPGKVLAAARGVRAAHVRSFTRSGIRHWRLGKGVSTEKAVEILNRRGSVVWAEPNHILRAHETLPDDPRLSELWGLRNAGQTGGAPDADIDAGEAWDLRYDASPIVVGIIDSGIDYNHEDLKANMWRNPGEVPGNGVDDDGNGIVDDVFGANFIGDATPTGDPLDDYGHGSHTAGTVGAVGSNGTGIVGVCWSVQLMALKFLDAGGRGTTSDAIEAIEYAASFGVPITSNSWGGGRKSNALRDAIAVSGALFVASAGNSGNSRKNYPAAYPVDNVIAVAATDHEDQLASFSTYGSWVHLAAPGVDILSCLHNNRYGTKNGTSMACPHVSGTAALLMAAYPTETRAQIKARLLDAVDPIAGLTDIVATGGRLNAHRALGGTPPPLDDTIPPGTVSDLAVASTTPYTAVLSWTAAGDDGSSGTAAYYDLRYHTAQITAANWDTASQAAGEPMPQASGATESCVVEGLESDTTYWFALRVFDEAGNASASSNVPSGTTLPAPPGAWQTEIVDTVSTYYKALDFHSGSGPYSIGCAYSEGDSVKVALYDGTSWQTELVVASGTAGPGIDFAFAPDGTPSVSFGWGKIQFAWRDGIGSWSVETIEKGRANNDYSALVYDPTTGEPTVAYRKGNDLRFARKTGGLGGKWQAETVEVAGARYQDMVYDSGGHAVIAYSDDPDGDGWLSALKVARQTDTGWSVTTLHTGVQGYGVYASIAVAPDGTLMAAHAGYSHVNVFFFDGSSWTEAAHIGDGGGIHAAFDATGAPYVSYSAGGSTYVYSFDGTAWQSELVDGKAGARTDIRRDPDSGDLGVLYGRQGGGVGFARKSAP